MPAVLISLGTNTGNPSIIRQAQSELERMLSDVRHSSIQRTSPIGISCGDFLNSITVGKTTQTTDELVKQLKALERRCGDKKSLRRQGIIVLDVDLLLYDTQRHHEEDWNRDYVQELASELLEKELLDKRNDQNQGKGNG